MNDKYISREAFKARIREQQKKCASPDEIATFIVFSFLLQAVDEEPAADVQPVKRGRWIKDEKGTFHHCSECGGETFRDVDSWGLEYQEYCTDYCPHCGARMIEDGDTNG